MLMEWGREEEENAGQLHIFTPSQEQKMRKHPEMWELQVTLNILVFGYFSVESWQHSITTELTQRRKWRLHLQQPGSSEMLYSRREEREGNQQQEPPPWLGE